MKIIEFKSLKLPLFIGFSVGIAVGVVWWWLVRPTTETLALFSIGGVSGIAGWKIGEWRNTCTFWKNYAKSVGVWNVPLVWSKVYVRYGSFLLVGVTSLVFASCWSLILAPHVNRVIAIIFWAALLALRWGLSVSTATASARLWLLVNRFPLPIPPRSTSHLRGVPISEMSPEEFDRHTRDIFGAPDKR